MKIHDSRAMATVAVMAALAVPVVAQPDVRQPGLGDNNAGPFGRPQPQGNGGDQRRPMQEAGQRPGIGGNWMAQMKEQMVRRTLTQQGVDEKTQAAVLTHSAAKEKSQQVLQEKSDKMRPAMGNNEAVADAQFNALLNDYLAALEDYRDSSAKADKALDAQIGYTKKPRLHAALLTLGVIGDAPQTANSMMPGVAQFTQMLGGPNGGVAMGFAQGGAYGGQQGFGGGGQQGFGGQQPGFGPPPGFGPDGGGQGFGGQQGQGGDQNRQQIEMLRREFSQQIQAIMQELQRMRGAQGGPRGEQPAGQR